MKTMPTFKEGWAVLAVLIAMFLGGCGNATTSSSTTNGSTASTVGGSSVTGPIVRIDLTTNRTRIAKNDIALVTVKITCSNVNGNCPVTSGGQPIFAAHPIAVTESAASSLTITANYSVSAAGTIPRFTDSLTLPGGSAATYTDGALTTPAILGATASEIDFAVNVTGTNAGAAILTVQSLSTVASIVIDVTSTTSGLFADKPAAR